MEKVTDAHSSVVLSKTKDGYEKIIFNLSLKSLFTLVCSFIFSGAHIFSSMTPFGAAFYGAVFSKTSWIAPFAVSVLSCIIFKNGSFVLNIAIFSLITAILGFFDTENQKSKKASLVSGSFLCLKLVFVIFSGYIVYDIFASILESAVVFVLVYVFETGFPVITSLKKRKFISTNESICTMTFLALGAMALSDYPDFLRINLSGTVAILMIYIFALGGINGGALVLSILMGTVGSLKNESFALITGTYAFGALLASALSGYGKPAVVLGFVIANTFSSLVLADATAVIANVYNSLGAALIFFILPSKYCNYFAGVFSGVGKTNYNCASLVKRTQGQLVARLEEMGQSFDELSQVYDTTMVQRELGKDYILTKFKEVKKIACIGCPKSAQCFEKSDSKGFVYMSKMLETAFKNGKITPHTMPKDFCVTCKRCDSFAEKFNSMFNVIKTERLWLSKLNDSRQLISSQLQAISAALFAEKERCMFTIDPKLEEKIWAELDKSGIIASDVLAQKDAKGDFLIEIFVSENPISDDLCVKLQNAVQKTMGCKVSYTYPKHIGTRSSVLFFTAKKYKVNAGFASKPKNGEEVSGDTFKLINSDGRNYFAVLSDGMGSGANACKESNAAVNLMEKFIKAGFNSDTAVKLINSSLLLKSARESFSTLDLCRVDLGSGTLSFTKLGAACSYIKKDNEITKIKACTLPAGILKDIEVESHYISLDTDTTVVLVSDGVADIELKNQDCRGWLKQELKKINTSNPQIIASKLCRKAQSLQGGNVGDDMTVIVLNIKKV
ncbi:MAG: SpoIIE family protein phosphatase [Clostridia bacterium]|nr:SpoIIE family protein phosphatase [Clostridia bacterium]